MSSTVAYGGLPRSEAYGASKAAIKHLFESLQADLFPEGISVSVVCPGFVRTALTDRNDFPMPFRIEAEEAARRIVGRDRAQAAGDSFSQAIQPALQAADAAPSRLYMRLLSTMVTQP